LAAVSTGYPRGNSISSGLNDAGLDSQLTAMPSPAIGLPHSKRPIEFMDFVFYPMIWSTLIASCGSASGVIVSTLPNRATSAYPAEDGNLERSIT